MTQLKSRHPGKGLPLLMLAMAVAFSACARGMGEGETGGLRGSPMQPLPISPQAFITEATSAYVLVDLDHNRLRMMNGEEILWEAPVGTGTGLLLRDEDENQEWEFSTPRGVFEVKFKEELPVWYLPDWYFIERGLPVPPNEDPGRRLEGQLGVAAVYLGEEIAIHGTDRPELLGQRVSHGCIRLENRFAQRLYHNVQIGTPIVIIGGESLASQPLPPTPPPAAPRPRPQDPLSGVSTNELLRRLGSELRDGDTEGNWVPLASRLITRGLKDDATALRGMLALAGISESDALNVEYGTFLADAFARGSLRVVVSLTRIEKGPRDRATRAIVDATMRLYSGDLDNDRAPWPTRRLHQGMLGPEGRAGWESLLDAEKAYRAALGISSRGANA